MKKDAALVLLYITLILYVVGMIPMIVQTKPSSEESFGMSDFLPLFTYVFCDILMIVAKHRSLSKLFGIGLLIRGILLFVICFKNGSIEVLSLIQPITCMISALYFFIKGKDWMSVIKGTVCIICIILCFVAVIPSLPYLCLLLYTRPFYSIAFLAIVLATILFFVAVFLAHYDDPSVEGYSVDNKGK